MAVFFTADTHFGHANVIKHCSRPFTSMEEMDNAMLQNWNICVKERDDIYIIGDFCFRGSKDYAVQMLKQLNGRKHLITGNHDKKYLKDAKFTEQFAGIADLMNLTVEGEKVVLCHYPMAEWDGYFRGSWHIYGHIHNSRNETFEIMRTKERALNAGVDITNFFPVSFDELKRCNEVFKMGESGLVK